MTNQTIIMFKNQNQSVLPILNVLMTKHVSIMLVKIHAKNHRPRVLKMHCAMFKNTDRCAYAEME